MTVRCAWAENDPLMCDYHDEEWSARTVLPESRRASAFPTTRGCRARACPTLRKRTAFREAFCGFDPATVAKFEEDDIARLLQDPGIVRSRAKIEATINGARIYIAMAEAGEDFASYVWNFVDGSPIRNETGEAFTQTPLSESISKDLKKRGFKFVGPVIVYAWMQAVGVVDDHAPTCFRYAVGATATQRTKTRKT